MFLPMGLIVFSMSSDVSPILMERVGMKKLIVVGLVILTLGFLPFTIRMEKEDKQEQKIWRRLQSSPDFYPFRTYSLRMPISIMPSVTRTG